MLAWFDGDHNIVIGNNIILLKAPAQSITLTGAESARLFGLQGDDICMQGAEKNTKRAFFHPGI